MRFALLAGAAALSGAAALTYELVWVRRLGEVTGSTAVALYVVLAVFFTGLGAGGRLGGRIADRAGGSIGVFVAMEALVALSALAFLPLVDVLDRGYRTIASADWPAAVAYAATGALALVALGVPALAMGGTIPALTRHVVTRADELAPRLAWLYGLNTLGGAGGVALTAFWLFPALEVSAIVSVGVALNVLAILVALAGRVPRSPARTTGGPQPSRPSRVGRPSLLLAAAAAGFASVALEVLWTRALSARSLNTVYSFATILLAYLASIAIGALITPLLVRARLVRSTTLALAVLLAGLGTLLAVTLLPAPSIGPVNGADRRLAELSTAIGVMALPLLPFGLAFPLIAALARGELSRTGAGVGGVYLANTIGAVLAPAVIGFWLLPALGLRTTLISLAWTLLLGGGVLVLAWSGSRARALGGGGVALAVGGALTLVAPADLRTWAHAEDDTLVEYVEGVSAGVAVVREADGNLFLVVGNSYRLGDARTRFAQHRQGLLPLLLHPEPRSALFIGMGTGSSAGAAAAHGGVAVDVVEILPELGTLLSRFAEVNERLAERAASDPSVRILAADARHVVRTTKRRYDVIVGDLFVPWRSGEGSMYTREHFSAVKDALAPLGLFCQWLPLYQLRPAEVRSITATMLDVFPHVEAYWLYFNTSQPCIGLLGSVDPAAFDAATLGERLHAPDRRGLLEAAGYSDVRSVLGGFIGGTRTLAGYAGDAPIETRERPLIEFLAPIRELDERPFHATTNTQEMLELASASGLQDGLSGETARRVSAYRSAVLHLLAGQLDARDSGRERHAMARYGAALMDAPDVAFVRLWLIDAVERAIEEGRFASAETGIRSLTRVRSSAHIGHHLAARLALWQNAPALARRALLAALRADPADEASRRLLDWIDDRWPGLEPPGPFAPDFLAPPDSLAPREPARPEEVIGGAEESTP